MTVPKGLATDWLQICPGVRLVARALPNGDTVHGLPDDVADLPESLTLSIQHRRSIADGDKTPHATLADGVLTIRCADTSAVYRQTAGKPDEFTRIA